MKRIMGNEEGSVRPIITIILVLATLYVGYSFAMPYYRYNTITSEAKEIARLGRDQQATATLVYEKVKDLGIPLQLEDIEVIVDNDKKRITIRLGWDETVNIAGIYEKTLQYKVDVTQ